MDSYLEIARKVLRESRQPLTARQILKAAYQLQIVPRDLYGRTQHKTLHARLATDILKRRMKSDFYRTGPGRFFLRTLKNDQTISARYKTEYIAPLRSTQLGRFDVIAFQRSEIKQLVSSHEDLVGVGDLVNQHWRYCRMDEVRSDSDMLAFRLFVILLNDQQILLSHRSGAGEDELPACMTLGFDGFVKREDKSLFSEDEVGLIDAVLRTIVECVELPPDALWRLKDVADSSAKYVLFEEVEAPASDDLMVVVSLDCSEIPEVVECTNKIAAMGWQGLPIRANDLSSYDRWSAKILSNPWLQAEMAD